VNEKSALVGTATSILPDGLAYLDAEERVFDAMLEGWRRQQVSRGLKRDTIHGRATIGEHTPNLL
jgi:hypothetical protein